MPESIKLWLKKPGFIKRLELFLAISLVLNAFQFFKSLETNKTPTIKNSQEKLGVIEAKPKTIDEQKLKLFLQDYLKHLFNSDLIAEAFLEKHSSPSLYENEIKRELKSRQKQGIKSKVNIYDSYFELESAKSAKVIITAKELFKDSQHQTREITIVLLVENLEDKFIVKAIPKFQIK